MRTCKNFEQASYIMPVIILQTHTDSYNISRRLIQHSSMTHTGDVLTVFFKGMIFFTKIKYQGGKRRGEIYISGN